MLNWILEASFNGDDFILIDKRIYYDKNDFYFNNSIKREREELKVNGASASFAINEMNLKRIVTDNRIIGFRFFRIVQISQNSQGNYHLNLSGFELYGSSFGNGWV